MCSCALRFAGPLDTLEGVGLAYACNMYSVVRAAR